MDVRIKLETTEEARAFVDIIDDKNTLNIQEDGVLAKLFEVFELKQKEQQKNSVPTQLRDSSIFVYVEEFKLSEWSIFDDMWAGEMTITFDSFKENKYRNTTPKFSKLFKIPVPSCYKGIKESDEYNIFEDMVKEFREKLPEFSLWTDSQITEFGDDFNRYIMLVSTFQYVVKEQMKDVALAMVLHDVELHKINYDTSFFNDKDYSRLGCEGIYKYLTQNNQYRDLE